MFYKNGWTDGLPVVPPTEDRVQKMVAGAKRDAQELIAEVPPRFGCATVEMIAINAVMAGCSPDCMPVLIAAVEAVSDERFKLSNVVTATHPCAPLILVNGPVAKKLGINGKSNAFGPGVKANATIGRALSLILLNLGGAIPKLIDKATLGDPAKYTYCVAENEDENPWEPLHVEKGFRREDSIVTVFACEGPHNINDHASVTAKGLLTTAASTMTTAGNNNLTFFIGEPMLILGPEHAATVARDGFSKQDVKKFIWEHAMLPLDRLSEENKQFRRDAPEAFGKYVDSEFLPLCKRPEDIVVFVVGGEGKHSCFVPSYGISSSVTKPVKL
ncbi:MAG: hypothetical protein HYX83_02710 [Chloroflexi bacterium]|nr:hypothetical protein [Chloroflexota bacterium]